MSFLQAGNAQGILDSAAICSAGLLLTSVSEEGLRPPGKGGKRRVRLFFWFSFTKEYEYASPSLQLFLGEEAGEKRSHVKLTEKVF